MNSYRALLKKRLDLMLIEGYYGKLRRKVEKRIILHQIGEDNLTNFDKVKEFMNTFGQDVHTESQWPSEAVCDLRVDLIEEELRELKEAMYTPEGTLVDVADALTDLLVVVYGAGCAFGIDLDECFDEVHRSNMSKLGADGNPIYREDGKVLKGPNYSEPNLEFIIRCSNGTLETGHPPKTSEKTLT
tara:strand:- start:1106 stop:1666 length:561 start_codon:yes stop_codon:yes gene_type:complete